MTTTTRIRSLDDLLGTVPHLLGHHPSDCVVLIPTRQRALLATSRIPTIDEDSEEPLADEAVVGLCRSALDAFAAHDADGVYAVVYAPRARALALLDPIVVLAAEAGMRVRDRVIVHAGRRYSPMSPDVRERVDGIPLPESDMSDVALHHVMEGSRPLPNRRAVRDLVLAEPESSARVAVVLDQAATRAPEPSERSGRRRVPRQARVWGGILGAGVRATPIAELTDEQVAGLLVSLSDVHWRDTLIATIVPGSLPMDLLPPGARRAARRWLSGCDDSRLVLHRLLALARRAPDECAISAALCGLVGCVAWHLGDGSIAGDAISRSLRIDPGHRLSLLLAQMIDNCVRPTTGPASGRTMAEAERPAV